MTRERMLVAAIVELGLEHLVLLSSFTKTAMELGLPSQADATMAHLDEEQLNAACPDLENLFDGLIAGIERHGLVTRLEQSAGPHSSGGPRSWTISELGRDLISRSQQLGAIAEARST